MMFTAFLAFLVAPMFQIVAIGTQMTEALAGLDRTQEVLREKPEDEDPRRTRDHRPIRGQVAFEDVSFAYDAGKPVLHDVSFDSRTRHGDRAGGAVRLRQIHHHQPDRGVSRAQRGRGAGGWRGSLHGAAGFLPHAARRGLQDTFLFDGTIRENVAFARPDATEEQMLEACRIARVDEFAEKFETGYDTIVGERGVKLSGGQRQRVSIARAILADPRILILDEATSSLDSESEAAIQEGLAYLMKGRTTFVIAHRLSTIRRADQILVVEEGRIVERGTHESLYARAGRYYDLYTRQHGLDANLFLAPGEGGKEAEDEEKRRAPARVAVPSAASLLRGGSGRRAGRAHRMARMTTFSG